jgi:peptidoglycan hydrolase-like protein with peptidoglycan-binding domain
MTAKPASIAIVLLLAGAPAFAQQSGSSRPAPATKPTHTAAPAKIAHAKGSSDSSAALAAAPDAARLTIQADLVWLGGFIELSPDEFDKHTAEAIRAFQRRNGGKDTGVLSDQERALLAQATQGPKAAVGWRLIDDTATGARLGVPEKLVPQTGAARLGSRWTSAHGQIQIETFRMHEASLPALFEQDKTTAKRYAGYSALSANSFVITGEQKLKKFVERAQSSGSEVRGVTVLYDQATEGTMASIAIAVADTFEGFPDQTAALPAGPRRGVDYSSALVVSGRGDLVALSDLTDNCQAITVPGFGHAERVAEDRTNNLALLRLYGARDLVPAAILSENNAPAPAALPAALTLYGIADQPAAPGGPIVTSAPAQLTAQGLDPTPKLGFAGGAALDAQDRFAGMVAPKPPVVAGIGPVALEATLVPAGAVRSFVQAQGITPANGQAAITQSVVRVICVRK